MNATRSLTFQATPWSIGLSVVAILATLAFCFIAWRRSGYRRAVGVLELLRLTAVILAAVLLNQPEWIEEFRPDEKASILVLWDASPSMETRDVSRGEKTSAQPETRREAVEPLTRPESWKALGEKMQVVIQPFSPQGAGRGTDLNEPLGKAPETIPNLRGVVLASDGDWNEGQPPVLAASKLRMKGVPVFSVPVGSSSRLPDIELLSLDAPTFGVSGKAVRVPFTIESSQCLGRIPRTVVAEGIRRRGSDQQGSPGRADGPKTSDELTWNPRGTGDFTLKLIDPQAIADEALDR